MKIFLTLLLLACCCAREEHPSPSEIARELLFGSNRPCADDSSCLSGICAFNMCVGYLLCSHLYMQERVAAFIAEKASSDSELRKSIIRELSEITSADEGDEFIKGRAAALLVRLYGNEKGEITAKLLAHSSEVVRFRAALQLCELGNSDGKKVIKRFLNHHSPPVRMLAENCLKKEGEIEGSP